MKQLDSLGMPIASLCRVITYSLNNNKSCLIICVICKEENDIVLSSFLSLQANHCFIILLFWANLWFCCMINESLRISKNYSQYYQLRLVEHYTLKDYHNWIETIASSCLFHQNLTEERLTHSILISTLLEQKMMEITKLNKKPVINEPQQANHKKRNEC